MSDMGAVKLVVGLVIVIMNGVLLRGAHAALAVDLMTHSHTPTTAFLRHARVTHPGAFLGL